MNTHRHRIAELAGELLAGRIKFASFCAGIPDRAMEDEDVSDLVDLIEHEPQRGGLLGVAPHDHDKHQSAIRALISKLSA